LIYGYNSKNSKFRSNINNRQRKACPSPGHKTGSQPPIDRPNDLSRDRPSGRTRRGISHLQERGGGVGRGAANVLKNGAATICLEDARALSRRRRRRRTPLVTIDITRRFAACDAYPQITHSSGWRAPNAAPGNPPLGKDPPGVFFICTKGGGVEQNLPAHVPFPKSSIGGPAPIFWPNFLGKNFGNKNRVV
jgi:hypothetical protein